MLARIARQLRFAGHVPPRRIARRLWLTARRALERRLRPALSAGPLTRSFDASKVRPLFPARAGSVTRRDHGWRFRFVGVARELTLPLDWTPPGTDQLWRMNMSYMEYLEGVDDAAFVDFARGWIAAHPPHDPATQTTAWNSYTIALRAVVWLQQLAARSDLRADDRDAIEASLGGQLSYLRSHLETDVGGNHLIKNIKALILGGAYFSGPVAAGWQALGVRLLGSELAEQILPDGMHFELSPAYHNQVFADLLEIRAVLGAGALGGRLDDALARMAQVTADIAHPDGAIAQFGDAGLSMAYPPEQCLAVFASLYGSRPAPRRTFALANAGYHGCRDGRDYAVFDAGAIAPASLPAHGHGDIGSFEWSLGGQRLVVDQGVFEYVAGPRRHASRSAASHNTLAVEGSDQAEFFGAFRIGRRARVTRVHSEADGEGLVLEVSHDGFAQLSGGPVHYRKVMAHPRGLAIEDRLVGGAFTRASGGILLHPDVAVRPMGSGQIKLSCAKANAEVRADVPLRIERATWWPDMGVERETVRLVYDLVDGLRSARIELRAVNG